MRINLRTISLLVILFCMIILSGLSGCLFKDKDIVEGSGTITYINLEGGFYGIVADDGEHYVPINLPQEFKVDGLRVRFKGKIRDDLVSIYMCGTLLELIYIKKL